MNKGSLARKVGLALVATLTAFAGLAPFTTPGAGAAENYTQIRYDGVDRFDTAALIAAAIAEATPTAVLARADDYPDALVGSYVASNDDSPILLTQTNSVPQRTLSALENEGVTDIILLGGPAAISQAVQNQLTNEGYTVSRIQGATRYHTAMNIARAGDTIGSIDGQPTALVSSAVNFPDALSGAPLSFAANLPSLLVPRTLSGPAVERQYLDETIATMNELGIQRIFILGGPAAVDQQVEAHLVSAGFDVARLQGANRGATSVEIFEFGMDEGIYTNRRFGLARGDNFPDALAYAPLAGRDRTSDAPDSGADDTGGNANGLLLANGTCALHDEVANFIAANSDTWTEGEILGGDNAICPALAAQVEDLASVGLSEITLDTTNASPGDTISGNIQGEDIESLTVSGCGLSNEDVDIAANGDFEVTIPNSADEDCALTFTTTFTQASGRSPERQTFQMNIDAPAETGAVTVTPSSGPSGGTATANYQGDRPGRITDISSTNCTIGSEGTQNNDRTFTVTGTQGTVCSIRVTVTFTDAQGGTDTFTDTYTITAGQASASGTSRPELQSATFQSTVSSGTTQTPQGTTVRYCFDEPVPAASLSTTTPYAPANSLYHLYRADRTQINPTTTNSQDPFARVVTGTNCVDVLYPQLTSTTGTGSSSIANITLATVDLGAATDLQGFSSPEGDAPLGSSTGEQFTAGRTQAPDLLTVSSSGNAPTATPTSSIVSFTFDQPAFIQGTAQAAGQSAFSVVLTDGTVVPCTGPNTTADNTGGTTGASGNGTTTINVVCPNAGTTPLTTGATGNIARGVVESDVVGTTPPSGTTIGGQGGAACGATVGGALGDPSFTNNGAVNRCNPMQASDTPHLNTPTVELTSVTLQPSTSGTTNDVVFFNFDQPITAPGAAAGYAVYEHDGDETVATTAAAQGCVDNAGVPAACPAPVAGTGTQQNQVAVFFPAGTLDDVTGGNVENGTVQSSTGQTNRDDEAAATNAPTGSQGTTAGRTSAPDLVSVALSTTGTFGNQFVATYTFDEAVDDVDAGRLFLHLADGTRLQCTTAEDGTPSGTAPNNTTVVCTAYNVVQGPGAGTGGTIGAGPASNAQVGAATLGTVDDGAVVEQNGAITPATPAGPGGVPPAAPARPTQPNTGNPEGAELTTGGTGTRTA